MKSEQRKFIRIGAHILLSCFVIFWYLFLNRDTCLIFREQVQMFLFSTDYLWNYLGQPGGITSYLGSFLTQFFYYPVLGTGIYLLLFWGMYKAFGLALKQFSLFEKMALIAFIPALLYLPASTKMQFDIADELSVMFALFAFPTLVRLSRQKFAWGILPLAVALLYILIGGSFVLSVVLLILYLLYKREKKSFVLIPVSLLSLCIPILFRYILYLVSLKNAYAIRTPMYYPDFELYDFPTYAWASVCLIPLIGLLLRKIKLPDKLASATGIALVLMVVAVSIPNRNAGFGNIIQMGFDAENHRWERILETNKKLPIGRFNCYYTNMALQQTGQLPYKMFAYDQIGTSGLLILAQDALSCNAGSELYYQLGLINEAQHQAYESMVSYSYLKEPDVRNLKRLLNCALISKNDRIYKKYKDIFGKTLFYRNYAKEQEENPSNLPTQTLSKNCLMSDILGVFKGILEADPNNRMAFEYLMAFYLLDFDYEGAKECYDRYFFNFPYEGIPVHYAEFLALYKRLKKLGDGFYEYYPIPQSIRDDFDIMDTLISATITENVQKTLDERFKDTYWYYVRFPLIQQAP